MRTERATRALKLLLFALLLAFGLGATSTAPAYAEDGVVSYGPPRPKPENWVKGGDNIGVTSDGRYCIIGEYTDCDFMQDDPNHLKPCEGASGSADLSCTKEERKQFEEDALKEWREKNKSNEQYDKINAFLTKCVGGGAAFVDCKEQAVYKYPPAATTPLKWVAGKISQAASDALQEAARYVGEAVVWLLKQFANAFNSWSTITLSQTGVGQIMGLSLSLSCVIAVFMLLVQFSKVAVSQDGAPAATALMGLLKWAAILAVFGTATQVALDWSDALSTWIMNYSFEGGGNTQATAEAAMQKNLGKLFAGLTASGGGTATAGALITGGGVFANAVMIIIVIGILCVLAIAGLWVEMMVRQAAIMILVATMPITLAGQMSDATKDWWPRARNALIALILMKPVIVMCFAIGFSAASSEQTVGVRNVLVGFVIFVMAGTSWPVLARFMVFTSNGEGNSAASGMISTLGSSMSAMLGGYQPYPSGPGTIGGGAGYTQALEEDNASTANSGSNSAGPLKRFLGGSGPMGAQIGPALGLGLQVAAAGKSTMEGAFQNAAAHAGLGPAAHGGQHVIIPPRGAAGAPAESEPEAEPDAAPAPQRPPASPAPQPVTDINTPAANWDGPPPTASPGEDRS